MSHKVGRSRSGPGHSDDEDDEFHGKSQRSRSSSRHHHHHHQNQNQHHHYHHHHYRNDRRYVQQQHQQQTGGSYHGGGAQSHESSNKRPKYFSNTGEELTEENLRIALLSLGSVVDSHLAENLRELCTTICNDLSKHKRTILNILIQCIELLPERITIYSTLVGLIHASVITFASDFLDSCSTQLKEHLSNNNFTLIQRYIRFFSDLVNVKFLSSSSILSLYDTLIQTTNEQNVPQVRMDFFVNCILTSLPYSGKVLSEKHNTDLNRLLHMIDKYVYKRSKIHVPILQVWTSIEPHPQEEFIDCLWAQIKRLNQDEWSESQIYRPYEAYGQTLFGSSSASIVHDLPSIQIPAHQNDTMYPLPKIVFRMFDYTDVPEQFVLPGTHSIERYLIEDEIANTIHTFHTERKDCAKQLLLISAQNKIPLRYMVIEVLFGHLFMLPRAPHLELFYSSLFLELCKLESTEIPSIVAQAVGILFERLPTMKTSCIERFSKWFAYHLSNFQFNWPWQEWQDCLGDIPESPKIKFIRETLQRCMRLSFHQRVIDFVPEPFYKLVPNKPSPQFKFEDSDPPVFGSEYAQVLNKKIRDRVPGDDILRILSSVPTPTKDDNDSTTGTSSTTSGNTSSINLTYTNLHIDLFTSSLIWVGSKSFTHSFTALARYHSLLRILIESEEQQIQVLKSMFGVWSNHQQMMVVLVDKLIKIEIVECSSVANWIFSSEMSGELTNFYVWEILCSTIDKMNRQVVKHEAELAELRRQLNISATTQAMKSISLSTAKIAKNNDENSQEESKMDDTNGNETESNGNSLKRRRESDDEDAENGQKMNNDDSAAPIDEHTAKLQEKYDTIEERLTHALEQQKKLFLVVFQRFVMVLSDFLNDCESKNIDPVSTPWLKWIIERLQDIFLVYHEQAFQYASTFESLIFTSDVDFCILEVFQQFCALRA